MSLSIRTNIASLNAQRNLSGTQSALDSSLSRLSSGFRITRAGDDAAGLGISTKLESQIRSYSQATRNANDGVSVVQASESALNEQASVLTRLRELAMQSASDGIGDMERGYVNKEAQALLGELERIAQVTEYNGTRLLNGTNASGLDFHVGIGHGANDVITLTTVNATTAAGSAAVGVPASYSAAASTYLSTMAANGWSDAAAQPAAEAAAGGATNATAGTWAALAAHEAFYVGYLSVAGFSLFPEPVPLGPAQAAGAALVASVQAGGTGGNADLAAAFTAYASTVAAGGTGGAARFAASTAATGPTAFQSANVADWLFQAAYSGVTGTSWNGSPLSAGAALSAGLAALGSGVTPAVAGGLAVAGLSLASKGSAQTALGTIDAALDALSSARAELGATGNRLQSAIANIQAFSESLSAANSRIKDVDVAEETSRMARSQILSQAGVSVLAQSNQMPQLALKLLG